MTYFSASIMFVGLIDWIISFPMVKQVSIGIVEGENDRLRVSSKEFKISNPIL